MLRPRPNGNVNITGKLLYGFPLWGKLSPQVTDEGGLPDTSPSSGAYRATFPQRGKAFPAGWVALPYNAYKNTAPNRKVRGGIFISCST